MAQNQSVGTETATGNNPASGVKLALPFSYEDVADLVIENRDKYDPLAVYYYIQTGELFAAPVGLHAKYDVELFRWSATDDETALEDVDLILTGVDEPSDAEYRDFLNGQEFDSFVEYLQACGKYNERVKSYLVRKMKRENLQAKWAALIQEANKSE
jgi:hypothetical protein